jgi:hypothetical protein
MILMVLLETFKLTQLIDKIVLICSQAGNDIPVESFLIQSLFQIGIIGSTENFKTNGKMDALKAD